MNPFKEKPLIPCVVQSSLDNRVLMVAYLNQEAYEKTLATGTLTFYSRSRQSLWIKGETSGNTLTLQKLTFDCDADTLLAEVIPSGPVCHTGDMTCFDREPVFESNRRVGKNGSFEMVEAAENSESPATSVQVLNTLFNCILDRKMNPKEGSYTTYLFEKGMDKVLKKVGEESAEVIIASKNPDKSEFLNECGDLLYHLWVLMAIQDLNPSQVYKVLESRAQ